MSKKGSKTPKTEVSTYDIGDTVLGKVRGYPPWPGRVVDPENLPKKVTKERPGNKKALHYCVQFFPTGDFSWLAPKDISLLQPHEIAAYISDPIKRSGDLLEGYKIARDPAEWVQERADLLAAAAADGDDDEEEEEALADEEDELVDEEERVATSKKRKAPSTAAATTSKKRKRDSDSGTKAKVTATKVKGAGKQRKSKAAVESEDEGAGDAEAGETSKQDATVSPSAAKKTKSAAPAAGKEEGDDEELAKDPEATKVREWRHRLQKVFLSSKVTAPKADDMPEMNDLFNQIETYEKINIAYLSFSKIGKVMRHITALSDEKVPLDNKYHFRDRAKVLVEVWQHIINASKDNNNTSSNTNFNTNNKNHRNGTSTSNAKKATTDSQSPGAENVNGIADAINSSIAGGTMEVDEDTKLNGHGHGHEPGHGHGHGPNNHAYNGGASHGADTDPVGDVSMLPDITMSEIGVE